jgi:hypothetical protein
MVYFNSKSHNVPKILTIQKLDCCDRLTVTSFASAFKSNAFDTSNYKRWHDRIILRLTTMNIIHVTKENLNNLLQRRSKLSRQSITFRCTVISVLVENLVDFYLTVISSKELWDALETKYGVSDAASELYVMKQLCDYKMVNGHSIVELAHKIQSLVKELEGFKCVLPEKFVARYILPSCHLLGWTLPFL